MKNFVEDIEKELNEIEKLDVMNSEDSDIVTLGGGLYTFNCC